MGMRCFISISLPFDIRQKIAPIIESLRKAGASVTWVHAENIHLTLKFLGNTDERVIEAMRDTLSRKLLHYKPFYIKIAGVGCFPSEKRPRVIWVGVETSEDLASLHGAVDDSARQFGFAAEERQFSAHLTVGRVKSPRRLRELTERLSDFRDTEIGTAEVSEIHIMKSELKPAGAEYSILAGIPIGTGRKDVQ